MGWVPNRLIFKPPVGGGPACPPNPPLPPAPGPGGPKNKKKPGTKRLFPTKEGKPVQLIKEGGGYVKGKNK